MRDHPNPLNPQTLSPLAWAQGPGRTLAVAALCLFGLGQWLHHSPLNAALMRAVHAQAVWPDAFWSHLTQWGDSALMLAFLLALVPNRSRAQVLVLRVWALGSLLTPLLKRLWDAPRPLSVLEAGALLPVGLPPAGGHSMPSGHALAAAAGFALLWLLAREARRPWAGGLLALGALVAASRVAVAAHWPADVLSGAGIGLAPVAMCWRTLDAPLWPRAWRLPAPWGTRLAAAFVHGLRLFLVLALWQTPADTPVARWTLNAAALLALGWQALQGWRAWHERRQGQRP